MCLERVYWGKEKKEALAKLPDEFPVWKTLQGNEDGNYTSPVFGMVTIAAGRQASPWVVGIVAQDCREYKAHWHANTTRAGACRFARHMCFGRPYGLYGRVVVKCAARKLDVKYIGEELGHVVVVLSHITFPAKCGKPKQ